MYSERSLDFGLAAVAEAAAELAAAEVEETAGMRPGAGMKSRSASSSWISAGIDFECDEEACEGNWTEDKDEES
jgi:hypothetical protein